MSRNKIKGERKGLKTWIVVVLFVVGLFLTLLGISVATLLVEILGLAIAIFLICQKGTTPKILGIILIVIAVIILSVLFVFITTTKSLEKITQEIENPEIINGTINQAVNIGNFSLVVTSVKDDSKIIRDCYYSEYTEITNCYICQPKSNYKFVILTLTITNNGIKQDNLDYYKEELKVDKGYIYEEADLYGCGYKEVSEGEKNKYEFDRISFYSSILPREHITGELAFEIPSDTEATNFILSGFGEPTVDIKLIQSSPIKLE